jgi:hypothetical protein
VAGRKTTIRQIGRITGRKTAGPQGVGQQYDDVSSDVNSDVSDDMCMMQDVGRQGVGCKT